MIRQREVLRQVLRHLDSLGTVGLLVCEVCV